MGYRRRHRGHQKQRSDESPSTAADAHQSPEDVPQVKMEIAQRLELVRSSIASAVMDLDHFRSDDTPSGAAVIGTIKLLLEQLQRQAKDLETHLASPCLYPPLHYLLQPEFSGSASTALELPLVEECEGEADGTDLDDSKDMGTSYMSRQTTAESHTMCIKNKFIEFRQLSSGSSSPALELPLMNDCESEAYDTDWDDSQDIGTPYSSHQGAYESHTTSIKNTFIEVRQQPPRPFPPRSRTFP